jgi:hypothetical protein
MVLLASLRLSQSIRSISTGYLFRISHAGQRLAAHKSTIRRRVSLLDPAADFTCETHEPCVRDLRLHWRDV